MRARFTTSIASAEYSFEAGATVSVSGEVFGFDTVPESLGRAWLASGVLELIGAESAAVTSPERAAFAAAKPRTGARN